MRTLLAVFSILLFLAGNLFSQSFEEQIATASKTIADGLNSKGKKKVAVSEFRDLDGGESLLGKYVADEVGLNLVNYAESYEMIERTRLDALLKEQKLSAEAIIDDSTRAEFGRISGVDAIVIGTITVFENDLRLTMRAIDTKTGSLVKVAGVDVVKNDRIKSLLNEKPEEIKLYTMDDLVESRMEFKTTDTRDCEVKNYCDVCFKNTGEYYIIKVSAQGVDRAELMIKPGERQCFYEFPAGRQVFQFQTYYRSTSKPALAIRSEEMMLKKCIENELVIK